MYKKLVTVVGITILFLGVGIEPAIAKVEPEKELLDRESNNIQYPVFGFFPYLGRGDLYRYLVFPGIHAFLNYWAFEGYVFIFRIKGYSTELPEYYSPYLPEQVMNLILKALNLI